jgi:hypothetical protein
VVTRLPGILHSIDQRCAGCSTNGGGGIAAAFGMILRDWPYKGAACFATVLDLAAAVANAEVGSKVKASRAEFMQVVQRAREIAAQP